jgi:hypothetical protein
MRIRVRTTGAIVGSMLLAACVPSAAVAQVNKNAAYFCAAEVAGGLYYNSALKRWEASSFKADQKFVLRLKFLRARVQKGTFIFAAEESVTDYEVTITQSGSNFAGGCESDSGAKEITVVNELGYVECQWSFGRLKFNLNSNRFLSAYLSGFVNGKENNDDNPAVLGGTCTKIE